MRLVCFLFVAILFAQRAPAPPGMQCHQRTLVLFAPGPNIDKQKDLTAAHFDYMRQQMRTAKIIAAGPFGGNEGAAIVFGSSDWAEVQDILKNEPYTNGGVIKVAEHRTWTACELVGPRVLPADQ